MEGADTAWAARPIRLRHSWTRSWPRWSQSGIGTGSGTRW